MLHFAAPKSRARRRRLCGHGQTAEIVRQHSFTGRGRTGRLSHSRAKSSKLSVFLVRSSGIANNGASRGASPPDASPFFATSYSRLACEPVSVFSSRTRQDPNDHGWTVPAVSPASQIEVRSRQTDGDAEDRTTDQLGPLQDSLSSRKGRCFLFPHRGQSSV